MWVNVEITVFWDVTPYSFVDINVSKELAICTDLNVKAAC
jgi:hypothetical protein